MVRTKPDKRKTQPERTVQDLANIPVGKLPIEGKVTAVKALKDLNFTVSSISQELGLAERSVWRYIKEYELPQAREWQEFGNAIKKLFEVKEAEIQAQTLSHIERKLPKAKFTELSNWYKVLTGTREGRKDTGTQTNQVIFQVVKGDK